MSRRVSRPAAALLALVISLSAPSAFAAQRADTFEPGFGPRIVRILKHFGKKLGIISSNDVVDVSSAWPGPPKP